MPVSESQRGANARPGFFAPFQVRPFRCQFAADLLTCWGMEMEIIVLGWYVMVETQSVLLLTLYGALQRDRRASPVRAALVPVRS